MTGQISMAMLEFLPKRTTYAFTTKAKQLIAAKLGNNPNATVGELAEGINGVIKRSTIKAPMLKLNIVEGISDTGQRIKALGIVRNDGAIIVVRPDIQDLFYKNCSKSDAINAAYDLKDVFF